MITIEITSQLLQEAKGIAKTRPQHLKNSITEGKGTVAGVLGELALRESGKGKLRMSDTPDYDLTNISNGRTIEVKTKVRTVYPQPNYNATVAAANATQNCDVYAFVSLEKNSNGEFTHAHIVGFLPPEEFFKKATFYKKYAQEPGAQPGWTFKADCYNVFISELRKVGK